MKSNHLAGIAVGFFGGILGAYSLSYFDRGGAAGSPALAATTVPLDVVSATRIRLVDASGKVRAELAMSGDGPGLFFYDTKGRNRLVLGLYPPAENEYPFIVLNDAQQQAAGIFRLFGGHETPVVVLKNQGRDRSVFGLNPNSTEPFLSNYAGNGQKTNVFGQY